jgi:hypothetical protein
MLGKEQAVSALNKARDAYNAQLEKGKRQCPKKPLRKAEKCQDVSL